MMGRGRLEAFSDGVIAIIITIMVLELHMPEGHEWADLAPLWPKFYGYVLSFIYVGIYWNNHHVTLHAVDHVTGRMLWANLHLLFWLSLIPATTAWMGESHMAMIPTMLYGVVLLLSGAAYTIFLFSIIASHGPDSKIAKAVGADYKGKLSVLFYVLGIVSCFYSTTLANAFYAGTALMWFIPDRRIARQLESGKPAGH